MDSVTLSPDSDVMRPSIVSPDLVVIASGKNCSQMTNLIDPKKSTRIVVTVASLIFIDAWCLCNGAAGFIDWLGPVWSISSVATENEFWNASKGDTANNGYGTNPFPSERSKRQKPKTVSKGSNRTENEKRASEVTVEAAASGGVEHT